MKFSCFSFMSEFCCEPGLCTPSGSSLPSTLELKSSYRGVFLNVETESHIRMLV